MPNPSNSPLTAALRKLQHWVNFSDDDRDALLALPYTLRTIDAQDYVVRDGDRTTQCCLLLSGFVYRHKIVADGGRQIFAIHMKGDLVDLQNSILAVADHNVQALTTAEVALIPREAIRRLAHEHPAVGEAMWHDTLVDGAVFREWIANVGRRDARTRIAHLLCEFAVRLEWAGIGGQTDYELPMTQEQLADCTGLTSVHVNRMLKSLSDDGLISRTKRAVSIDDWNRLAAAGDFGSAYLHMRPNRFPIGQ